MARTEEEFLTHVKETFQQEEFPYQPGAWENFQQQHRKRKYTAWIGWTTQAAVFILFFFALFYWKEPLHLRKKQDQSQTMSGLRKRGQILPERSNVRANKVLSVLTKRIQNRAREVQMAFSETVSIQTDNSGPGPSEDSCGNAFRIPAAATRRYSKPAEKNNPFLALKDDSPAEFSDTKKWKYSVLISNSYSHSGKMRLGIGGGLEYALNGKASIMSGLSLNQLSALSKMEKDPSNVPGKTLTSVQTSISGLDVPIDFKYSLNSNTYVSIGISVTGILRKSQVMAYEEKKFVSVLVTGENGPSFESKLMSSTETVPVASGELPQQNYLCFYNLSYGFNQKISKRQHLIIEPFIKIPMRPYSDLKTNLTSGGIRLKLEF
ncbi:hypothetical protein DBR11_25100 [Pedobacter sp. HMWF019]|uniref:hypothetical protein n=1 Tax=Pedobacter sp. HMWF019 TaxID=2056856 RepID=UPI000D36BF9A|nr:hypothetical protein [Pedobacter sp. HMWF019]PTS93616.1 hypothetical protein DBR11_25100 [Pedobacter sp. HMWF019]